jgi:hypothetical protein
LASFLQPPSSDKPPGGDGNPAPKYTSPSSPTTGLVRPVAPTVPTLPVLPPSMMPKVSEPSKIAEITKTAEVSKTIAESSSHTAIKNTIGDEAESMDYTVCYEEHFPSIEARADVVLRRGKQSIICQVSAKTPPKYEAKSVLKFLKLDFTHIAVVSINRRKLNRIQESLSGADIKQVGFYSPEEFISNLHAWAMDDPGGAVIEKNKPRKRQILFGGGQLSEEERRQHERKMLNDIQQAMKKK